MFEQFVNRPAVGSTILAGGLLASALLFAACEDADARAKGVADGALDAAVITDDAGLGTQDGRVEPTSDATVNAADAAADADLDASGSPEAGSPDGAVDSGPVVEVDSAVPTGPVKRCVVFLHGKSGSGFASRNEGNYTLVGPTGNADGWGGRQWLYFPDPQLEAVRNIIAQAITSNGCTRTVIHGFSNGAAAAAKLYCRGNTFGGAVVGYVVDDPVPDHGADNCAPAAGMKVRLYWTGGLTPADGWNCQEGDWTCEGGQTVGITKYSSRLGTQSVRSVNTQHAPYGTPPEYAQWL